MIAEEAEAITEPALELIPDNEMLPEPGEMLTEEPLTPAWIPEAETPLQPEVIQTIDANVEPVGSLAEPLTEATMEEPEGEIAGLEDARSAINQGQPAQAAAVYQELIKHNQHLTEVIRDVQEALYRFPVDVNLWVVLGDAFIRSDDLQEALNAYTKAEDLVR